MNRRTNRTSACPQFRERAEGCTRGLGALLFPGILLATAFAFAQVPNASRNNQSIVKPNAVHFENIARQAGLIALNVNGNDKHNVFLPEGVGSGAVVFDYDNDGWVDLFVANGHVYPQLPTFHQRNLVHRNNRDGTFTEVGEQLGAPLKEKRAGRGVAFGDIDNDGDVDLVINNLDGAPQLLRNDGGNANNSVLIKLLGVKSNRDGIGARVKIVSGDLTQVDEVRSGGSYISQNDLRLHFGLEKRSKIDLIEIRWPSGAMDRITTANANKIITVKEGQGVVEQKDFKSVSRR